MGADTLKKTFSNVNLIEVHDKKNVQKRLRQEKCSLLTYRTENDACFRKHEKFLEYHRQQRQSWRLYPYWFQLGTRRLGSSVGPTENKKSGGLDAPAIRLVWLRSLHGIHWTENVSLKACCTIKAHIKS